MAIAVPSFSSAVISNILSQFTAPAASNPQSSIDVNPDRPHQTDVEPHSSSTQKPITSSPHLPSSAVASIPSGGSAGIIAPEQGSNGGGLTLPDTNNVNIGSIVGGIIGGVAGLALIVSLLFFCLRKRNTRIPRWNEKTDVGVRFTEKLKTVSEELGNLLGKFKWKRVGTRSNPYRRHTAQISVNSVYSTHSDGRGRSISEPQSMFAIQRGASIRSTSSKKSSRNLLRKKPSSISSNYRFPSIVEGSASRNKDMVGSNPFADPDPLQRIQLLNSDHNSGPMMPQPTAASGRLSRDPFASLLDQFENMPDWLRDSTPAPGHTRMHSSASALQPHLPSSAHHIDGNPFSDSARILPSSSTQAIFPYQKRRSSIANPTSTTTSTAASRNSHFTLFGEPGPSRPGTNLFTPGLATNRAMRQSDPFDLDRPEVLGFGEVLGRKEVQTSVTRQVTRSKRTSSVGNRVSMANRSEGPYERDNAKVGPLWSANGGR